MITNRKVMCIITQGQQGMKKLIILLSIVLFNCGSLYSMERELSCIIYNKVSALAHYFKTSVDLQQGYGDQLPLVVQGAIIKNVFNLVAQKKRINQKNLEEYVLEIPLALGCKFIGEFVQMQKICEEPICGKFFLPHELFCLPRNEKDVFIRMAYRPWIQGGNSDNADYKIIKKMSRLDLKKGLCLKVLPDDKVIRLCDKIKHIGVIGIAVGVPSMVFCLLPRESWLGKGLTVMSLVGIFGGYGLAFSADGAIYLYNKFYCD
jgi:hypothetical protein